MEASYWACCSVLAFCCCWASPLPRKEQTVCRKPVATAFAATPSDASKLAISTTLGSNPRLATSTALGTGPELTASTALGTGAELASSTTLDSDLEMASSRSSSASCLSFTAARVSAPSLCR